MAIFAAGLVVGGGVWFFRSESFSLPAQVGTAPICDPALCGNNIDDAGEQCDDGNQIDGDTCDPLCRTICTNDFDCPSGECSGGLCENLCGNGIVEPPICTAVGGIVCPPPNVSQVSLVNLPAQILPMNHIPADVDGDGNLDVVVWSSIGNGSRDAANNNFYTSTVDVILGNGDGTFEPRRTVATTPWNSGIGYGFDVLDVDQDDDMDIILHTPVEAFLLTNDDLTFTRTSLFGGFFTYQVRHHDINEDGDPDLLIHGYYLPYVLNSPRSFVAYGLPGGAFQEVEPIFDDITTVYDTTRIADMDGDGDDDVVGTSSWMNGYTVRMYRNSGGGFFDASVEVFRRDANPHTLTLILEDMNGDGSPDIVLASNNREAVVLTNDGNGGVARSAILPLPFLPMLFAVADPSDDGIPDVVWGLNQGNEGAMKRLWYARGNGDGTFQPSVPFVTWDAPPTTHVYPLSGPYSSPWIFYANGLKSADYNNDGRMDLSMPHATYSDSVTVFLFGDAPITPCVDVPPVISCSQREECDEGILLNGTPGHCTARCTYCGNGQIDTVNTFFEEECDEGAQNGQLGSLCTTQCTNIIIDPVHTECLNQQCVLKLGPGTNGCTEDAHCIVTEHLGCTGVGACTIIQGPGMDLCATGADCCDPADPLCVHDQCEFIGETCDETPGPGLPQCSANVQCEDYHFSCENEQCSIQPGDGPDTCTVPADCVPPCIEDNFCAADESCSCSDCASEPQCVGDPVHTECLNQQCVLKLGPGTNGCTEDAHCTATEHLGCTGVGACTIIQGPGMDLCATGADCCDPADPLCVHDQCEFIGETCDEASGPGLPQCSANVQCEDFHFSCENEQCSIQPGDGPDTCTVPADCVPPCNLDNICGANETCLCGDCADTPACIPHLQCNTVNRRCEVVLGIGTNTCQRHEDCIPNEHLACVNQACVIVQEPGMNTCAINADCCDPADPLCTHRQCNPFTQSCIVIPGPALDQCTGSECTLFHSVCVGNACEIALGPGTSQCNGSAMCDTNLCGNGLPDPGEACDDGNTVNSDACNTLCQRTCTVDSTLCNCDETLGICIEQCGDGEPDPGEACDDGNTVNNDACNNLCQRTCTVSSPGCICDAGIGICIEQCGDGEPDPGEQCDDGNAVNTDTCTTLCRNPRCGDGFRQGSEQCDDGNTVNTDACTNLCQNTCTDDSFCPCDEATGICLSVCGNGPPPEFGEDCDEGSLNRTTPPNDLTAWYCNALTCTRSVCFDGSSNDGDQLIDALDAGCWRYDVQAARNRGFSFIGSLLGQTSTLEPLVPEVFLAGKGDENCPAETVDQGAFCALTCEAGDICPDGEPCPQSGVCPLTCGNQLIDIDLGEQCDDGNLINDDGCTNLCRTTCVGPSCPRCGDGTVNVSGEQCDDGNQNNADACSNNCAIRCDEDADCVGTCNLSLNICTPPSCGDGKTNQVWERCDDGDIDNTNACNNQCQPTCSGDADCESGRCNQAQQVCTPLCGNGYVDTLEQCDDGNLINNDGCTNLCERQCTDDATCDCDEARGVCRALCGNGRLDTGEGCDDGNTVDRDQCSNSCQVRCRAGTICPDSQACPQNGLCPPPAACGDGIVNGDEQCDDGNLVDGDACTASCTLRCGQNLECPNGLVCLGEECSECSSSLQCDTGFCVDGRCRQALPLCGNGVREAGEACDDGNADNGDACTVGCLLAINQACEASAQCQTHLCQSGTCQPCADAGQCASGLRCSQGNCLFGPLQCGDGAVQAGEACDDANFVETDQCTTACVKPFGVACDHASQCASTICSAGACAPCRSDSECSLGLRCAIGLCLTDAQMSMLPNLCGNGLLETGESCDDGNAAYGDGCTPMCTVGSTPLRAEVGTNTVVQMPFVSGGLHAGAGDGLSDTGPATVAVMAAGAAAGAAWVRRRRKAKRS